MISFSIPLLSVALLIVRAQADTTPAEVVNFPASISPKAILLPRYAEYRAHCEADSPEGSDPKWPCFTFWSGDLEDAVAEVDDPNVDVDKDVFLIKDGFMKDFTVRDPTKPFSLTWEDKARLIYKGYKKESGCYQIQLSRIESTTLRIWVSDEDNKERKVDTFHHENPDPVEICTKWSHIHVKYDGDHW